MKNLIKTFGVLLISISCFGTTQAQTSKADKKAAKTAEIKNLIDKISYVFKANYVNPLRGNGKILTSDYDVTVTKDKLDVYLPYFGRAYAVPMGPEDGGVKLVTTHFDYKATQNKKGGWDILIKPKDKKLMGAKDIQQLLFTLSSDGFGTLQITSFNRDPISFNGNIEEIKKEK